MDHAVDHNAAGKNSIDHYVRRARDDEFPILATPNAAHLRPIHQKVHGVQNFVANAFRSRRTFG
jgi:hypothetical protein